MIIDCISDLHGHYPDMEGGDLLIVAGDFTANHSELRWSLFVRWINTCACLYRKIVVVAGNHDVLIEKCAGIFGVFGPDKVTYLCDSGTEFEGLKIWGSPWTAEFEGMNPICMAFTLGYGCDTEDRLAEKWALIPDGIDILVTHSPPYGILDKTEEGISVGSRSLIERVCMMTAPPKLWVFGHIHEAYGIDPCKKRLSILVNASHVNRKYKPVNEPIRIEL